ncbi:Sodium/hydrogen exchanger 9B2 [Acropora cervicornis]|uniref:Sodium/hydrogen exchanger 9B2 n=1 Tax=Acropora cervicornis TaxID=6130 RepID=A0AAD9VG70_ACRCE|nr:Sodium/hydrogen exchanger 9B2 [Acropora cervicornis]
MADEGDVQNSAKETPVAGKKARIFQRFRPLIPPSGFLGRFLTRGAIVLLSWAVLWSIVGRDVLAGGNIFGIFIVIVLAALGGFLTRRLSKDALPSLLGMLIVGFILRNVPGVDVARYIDKTWSASLRSMALVVILTRSGLELDPGALKRLKFSVIRLAFCPCIGEAIAVAVVGKLLLDMPWLWGFQLGFVLGAVTPAVVVPQLLTLQAKGFGVKQGIPTLVMAASSFDDVIAISLFGVFLGIAFSKGNLVFNIFRGPIELLMGVVFGSLVGLLCWFLPNKMEADRSRNRFVILLGCALLSVFGSNKAQFSGAGALGVLVMATMASYGWGDSEKAPVADAMAIVWEFFQPLLFGLIGAEVSIEYMDSALIGKAFGLLTVAMVIRMIVTFFVVSGNSLSVREKIFVAIAWSPKATVQAAIGSLSLDIARERGFAGMRQEELGIQILTIAVLSILFTAPSGAVAIAVSGPRLLQKVETRQQETGDNVEAEPIFDDHHSEGLEFNAIT